MDSSTGDTMLVDGPSNESADMSSDSTVTTVTPQPQEEPIDITGWWIFLLFNITFIIKLSSRKKTINAKHLLKRSAFASLEKTCMLFTAMPLLFTGVLSRFQDPFIYISSFQI